MRARGIFDRRRDGEAGGREAVAARVVVALAQVDRQRHAQLDRRRAVPFVVAADAADDRGDEHVVEARVGRLRDAAHLVERHVERLRAGVRGRGRSMIVDIGLVAGASVRAIERVVRTTSVAAADRIAGSRAAVARRAPTGMRRAIPSVRR